MYIVKKKTQKVLMLHLCKRRDEGPKWPNPEAIVLISTMATQQYERSLQSGLHFEKHVLFVSNIVSERTKPRDNAYDIIEQVVS